jgi:hypothetical protein
MFLRPGHGFAVEEKLGLFGGDSRWRAASEVQLVPTAQTPSRRQIPGSSGRIVWSIVAFLLCRLGPCHTPRLTLGIPHSRPEGESRSPPVPVWRLASPRAGS